jgi:hypothetical protein
MAVDAEQQPMRELSGRYVLSLKELAVQPGDDLKVTLEAFDYRGEFAPESSLSEPFVLKVTDEAGFWQGMSLTDERSLNNVNEMIRLFSGDTK